MRRLLADARQVAAHRAPQSRRAQPTHRPLATICRSSPSRPCRTSCRPHTLVFASWLLALAPTAGRGARSGSHSACRVRQRASGSPRRSAHSLASPTVLALSVALTGRYFEPRDGRHDPAAARNAIAALARVARTRHPPTRGLNSPSSGALTSVPSVGPTRAGCSTETCAAASPWASHRGERAAKRSRTM